MSTESAYPDRLLSYASSARGDTAALTRAGTNLSTAIQTFVCSAQDPVVISGVTDWGAELTSYARKKSQIDQWVHDVGVRFQTADSGHPARSVTITDGSTWTFPQAVAQQHLDEQQRKLQDEQDRTAPGQWGPLGQKPIPDNGPRAEPAPPGWQQRAQAWHDFLNWLAGGDGDPHDPEEPQWLAPPPNEVPRLGLPPLDDLDTAY